MVLCSTSRALQCIMIHSQIPAWCWHALSLVHYTNSPFPSNYGLQLGDYMHCTCIRLALVLH
eukprot:7913026-Alexandrium_andersonii.AAC.1